MGRPRHNRCRFLQLTRLCMINLFFKIIILHDYAWCILQNNNNFFNQQLVGTLLDILFACQGGNEMRIILNSPINIIWNKNMVLAKCVWEKNTPILIILHEVTCSNLTKAKHSKHWDHWRVYKEINFRVSELIEVRASWPWRHIFKSYRGQTF